ncbi:MAG: sigma 54-interacting transcriptional regulator [Desulfobacterales bacterium]|nr:sigma 54-interacting transcriptional regulator [Desulfobacterales bacterium]
MDEEILTYYCEDIINAISDGLIVVSRDGILLIINAAMERITGYSRKELIGSSCTALNCDACEMVRRSDENQQWCRLFEFDRIRDKRCLFMRKDGTYASVIKNAYLLRGPDGEITGAMEMFRDVTELDKKDSKIRELSMHLNQDPGYHGIVGRSSVMQGIYQIIEKAAQTEAPVIILGESGTGKELVAHAIHQTGRRRDGPFIKFNCAALNESLLESELFGHTRGAFTGAHRHRQGRFEAAHGGEIFLDEIGDISPSIQAKLLRVLELKQFERVGANTPIDVDVRIITATNRNLAQMIVQGTFRQDLFFRINVFPIHLPPLRERFEDIPLLVEAFIHQMRKKNNKRIRGVSPAVMKRFMEYGWPGNIRELKSALEYAFVVAESGLIDIEHLPEQFSMLIESPPPLYGKPFSTPGVEPEEKTALTEALHRSGGNKTRAAEILGVHRMTVWNRMRKYEIRLNKNIEP